MRRITSIAGKALALTLSLSMATSALPVSAFAADGPADDAAAAARPADETDSAADETAAEPFDTTDETAAAAQSSSAADDDAELNTAPVTKPSSFDLRNVTEEDVEAGYTSITKPGNYVTPVKRQNPFGACWGFSVIAAAETSILTSQGTTYEDTLTDALDHTSGLDLSERQLAYFAYTYVPEVTGNAIAESQAGEGYHNGYSLKNALSTGGFAAYGTDIFASGTGPVSEDLAPYANDEGVMECTVSKEGEQSTVHTLTEEQVKEYEGQGYTVVPTGYAATIYGTETGDTTKDELNDDAVDATWSLDGDPSSDDCLWGATSYELAGSNILPEPVIRDDEGNYLGTDEDAIDAIRSELLDGRAVSISFCGDRSAPDEAGGSLFINQETWAHYTFSSTGANHAVTIVGYDDNYPAENFNPAGDYTDPSTGVTTTRTACPADGAFLVKNSWGAGAEEFPNKEDWGLENEDGVSTGYFWLSYYDQSLTLPETFEFDLTSSAESESYTIDQYDYTLTGSAFVATSEEPLREANVFTATEDRTLRSIGTKTAAANTRVTYEVYLLDADDEAPVPEGAAPVASFSETYEYAGYHRENLGGASGTSMAPIEMEEGQRYSVVVTQRCLDDGLYYLQANTNAGKPTEDDVTFKQMMMEAAYYMYYRDLYMSTLEQQAIADGQTEEEAKATAEAQIDEVMAGEEAQAKIKKATAEAVEGYANSSYVGVVNEGESYAYDAREQASWSDWTVYAGGLSMEDNTVYDNFPIKTFSDVSESSSTSYEQSWVPAVVVTVGIAAMIGAQVAVNKRKDVEKAA